MKYGLIGEKLGHSFSKEIHGKLGDYEYELLKIERDRLDGFMREKNFLGINVTIPYKEMVIPYLKDMDKYSFDLSGIITGGKSKTITKDEKTGKITVTKGKDGNYGVDLDITVLNRKD